MTVGTGIFLIDFLAFFALGWFVGRALGYVLMGTIEFIRYRRQDGRQNHTGFRK